MTAAVINGRALPHFLSADFYFPKFVIHRKRLINADLGLAIMDIFGKLLVTNSF